MTIFQVRGTKKRILPAHIRNNPFADPPPINEDDINCGMYSLVRRGLIPKDVDLTPAFNRGGALLKTKQAIFNDLTSKFEK